MNQTHHKKSNWLWLALVLIILAVVPQAIDNYFWSNQAWLDGGGKILLYIGMLASYLAGGSLAVWLMFPWHSGIVRSRNRVALFFLITVLVLYVAPITVITLLGFGPLSLVNAGYQVLQTIWNLSGVCLVVWLLYPAHDQWPDIILAWIMTFFWLTFSSATLLTLTPGYLTSMNWPGNATEWLGLNWLPLLGSAVLVAIGQWIVRESKKSSLTQRA